MTRFQLSVHAQRVPRRGLFRTKPTAYAKVTVTGGPQEGTELGRTESIVNSRDADWVKTIFLETSSAVFMPLKVSILHENDYNDDELLAEANFEATEVFQNAGHLQWEKVGKTKYVRSRLWHFNETSLLYYYSLFSS